MLQVVVMICLLGFLKLKVLLNHCHIFQGTTFNVFQIVAETYAYIRLTQKGYRPNAHFGLKKGKEIEGILALFTDDQ